MKNFSETSLRGFNIDVQGKIVEKLGRDVADWKNLNNRVVSIGKTSDPHLPIQAKYMFELLSKKSANLRQLCRAFGSSLCNAWNIITGLDTAPPTNPNARIPLQTKFRTWGRILGTNDGKLKADAIFLEGTKLSRRKNEPATVQLDLTNVQSYSMFPGQILAVEGTNPSGNSLVVQSLFAMGYPKPLVKPKLSENLHIVVAAGPFTNNEGLEYQPLFQLMDHVVELDPHVLILVGPFVPVNHPEIENATIENTFQELFEKLIEKLMSYINGYENLL